MAKKNVEGFAFLVKALEANKNAVYADVKAAAEKKGLTVFPVMFGRAKLKLGLVKRGQGKAKMAAAARAAGNGVRRGPGRPRKNPLPAMASSIVRRGPGRPRKNPLPAAGFGGLDSIVAAVRGSQQDLQRYRGALERIHAIVAGAM